MIEYKVSKGWSIFVYVATVVVAIIVGGILAVPIILNDSEAVSAQAYSALLLFCLFIMAVMVFGIVQVIKGRFVIESDRIYQSTAFSTRELLLNDIRGYRFVGKYLYIEPSARNVKRIRVLSQLARFREIQDWLIANYPNLDAVEAETERSAWLNDSTTGNTQEGQEALLNKAQSVAMGFNIAGVVLGAWLFFVAKPLLPSVMACVAIPVIGIGIMLRFKDMIRLDERKNSTYPSIIWGIGAASLGLLIKVFRDYKILDYSNAGTYFWPVSIALVAAFLILGRKHVKLRNGVDFVKILFLLFFCWAYGYGSVINLNSALDTSSPEPYTAQVMGRRVSHGKSNHYYLTLSPWGPQAQTAEESVSSDFYARQQVGSTVNIRFRKGWLDIPWYVIAEGD